MTHNKLCQLDCKSSTAGDIIINSKESNGYNRFFTEINRKTGENLGSDTYGIYPEEHKIFDFSMEILPQYRQKGLFLGELLRLKSIIELLENNLDKIELTSKKTAIYFHSKFKFIPKIKNFTQRDYTLKTIANNSQKDFLELSQKAQYFLELINKNLSGEEERKLCKKTSELDKEYIDKVLSLGKDNYKNNPFDFPIDMVLEKNSIIENKDYFNKLFIKHNIDYKI